jgi:hypothetical protein
MTLPGPSRRIIVQPFEAPAAPAERDPVVEPFVPEHDLEPRPEPEREREREPVPAP